MIILKRFFGAFALLSLIFTPVLAQADTLASLSVDFQVRNVSQNIGFSDTVNARGGDTLEYQIKIKNTGAAIIGTVSVADSTGATGFVGAKFNYSVSRSYIGSLDGLSNITVYNLEAGQETVITYRTVVNNFSQTNTPTVCANALATGSNANPVTDSACIVLYPNILSGGSATTSTANVWYSSKAFNDTKNVEATLVKASREDFITYTLTAQNNSNTDVVNFVFSTDLSGILPLANMIDISDGIVNNQTLVYPGLTVPAFQSVSKIFRVRVKYALPNVQYIMQTSFGNLLQITIDSGTVAGIVYTAPKTGSETDVLYATLLGFSAIIGFAFVDYKKFKAIIAA